MGHKEEKKNRTIEHTSHSTFVKTHETCISNNYGQKNCPPNNPLSKKLFNPRNQEAETNRSLSLKPVCLYSKFQDPQKYIERFHFNK